MAWPTSAQPSTPSARTNIITRGVPPRGKFIPCLRSRRSTPNSIRADKLDALIHRMNDVGPGLLVVLESHQSALLRFQQEFVERTETVSALIEPGILPFDGLFYE